MRSLCAATTRESPRSSEDPVQTCWIVFIRVRLFVTPWTVPCQAPPSTGILQARILEWVAMTSSRGIFPTQGSNSGLLHCRWILYHLSHKGSPSADINKQIKMQVGNGKFFPRATPVWVLHPFHRYPWSTWHVPEGCRVGQSKQKALSSWNISLSMAHFLGCHLKCNLLSYSYIQQTCFFCIVPLSLWCLCSISQQRTLLCT